MTTIVQRADTSQVRFLDVVASVRRALPRILLALLPIPLVLVAVGEIWAAVLPEVLKLTPFEAVVLTILIPILRKVLILEERVSERSARALPFIVSQTRIQAYDHICEVLRDRRPKQGDLLQVSGATAHRVLTQIAAQNPTATMRILLVSDERAATYDRDRPGFHTNRIAGTIAHLELLVRDYPSLTVGIWQYSTEPGIAGVLIDDWLVSVGWYHVFANAGSPDTVSILGHAEPAITALDKDADPLLRMVRAQFDAVLRSAGLRWCKGPNKVAVESSATALPRV